MLTIFMKALLNPTSPQNGKLFVAVNTALSLAAQGDVETVKVFSSNPGELTEIDPPYIRVYNTGMIKDGPKSISNNGCVNELYTEFMGIDCVAVGETDLQSEERTGLLAFAVESVIHLAKGTFSPETLRITDVGGSGSTIKVQDWESVTTDSEPSDGPGNETGNPICQSTKQLLFAVHFNKIIRP